MNDLPAKALLRPDEIAAYLRLSTKTIYGWIAVGKLDAIKINGVVRIKKETVEKAITPAL